MAEVQKAARIGPPLRVVLVDDHEMVRAGLAGILTDAGMQVVGEASDVDEGVASVAEARPDVLVLDVRLPGGGGPAVLEGLDEIPATLAVSASDERDDVVRTIQAGATGYLLKTAAPDQFVDAVRSTAAGDPVFSPELAGHLLDLELADHVEDPEWESLTDREREVLRYLARGRTYKEIAAELFVAPKTVETHVRNVLHKLHLTNRHEAARWAAEHGFEL
ncbi:MAG: response regulator transcription factor [Nitriliruptorales bacterium]|nr:response regulator transcription factor [Nitriliruptorales bacterium]